MARNKRVKRPKSELINELRDQLILLVHACHSYDNGLHPVGKYISLSLRLLLHHHGQSKALLEQLGLRSKRFLDTAGDLNPNNVLTDNLLCIMRMGGENSRYLPRCAMGGGVVSPRWLPFAKWWNNDVLKDNKGYLFNRRELILNVADTDGGAHVDPALDKKYMDLSRNNSLGWVIEQGSITRPFPSPTMPCIRQIAHEVIETLKVKAKDLITIEYEPIQS